MRVLILGGDGYLGWPTAMYFASRGHEVAIVDNLVKRFWEAELNVEPLFPIASLGKRVKRWNAETGKNIKSFIGDIAKNHRFVYQVFDEFGPEAVIHYAEQPSAPYSMMNRQKALDTQINNVAGTMNVMFAMQHASPDAHMIKLGTMGEYGTPNIDIEEGWIEIEHKGRKDRMLYPKKPHSFYHLSKVHDSANLEFACRVWGMRATDLNQGVVYGTETEETLMHPELETSFHYDAIFGTVLNRFITQAAAGIPLTIYGGGGQQRGFLNILDTLRCVELAALNPADPGEFRVFNQITEQFSIGELASRVKKVAENNNLNVEVDHVDNPRTEQEDHYYNVKYSSLIDLGLEPHYLTDDVIERMLKRAVDSKNRVDLDQIYPSVKWKQG